jgi:hypothetical protein
MRNHEVTAIATYCIGIMPDTIMDIHNAYPPLYWNPEEP